jgi:hypothetical protein
MNNPGATGGEAKYTDNKPRRGVIKKIRGLPSVIPGGEPAKPE